MKSFNLYLGFLFVLVAASCSKPNLEEGPRQVGYLTIGVSDDLKDNIILKSGGVDSYIYAIDVFDADKRCHLIV